eukprot:scaffold95164_cov52-Attheya_sp.AAC.1
MTGGDVQSSLSQVNAESSKAPPLDRAIIYDSNHYNDGTQADMTYHQPLRRDNSGVSFGDAERSHSDYQQGSGSNMIPSQVSDRSDTGTSMHNGGFPVGLGNPTHPPNIASESSSTNIAYERNPHPNQMTGNLSAIMNPVAAVEIEAMIRSRYFPQLPPPDSESTTFARLSQPHFIRAYNEMMEYNNLNATLQRGNQGHQGYQGGNVNYQQHQIQPHGNPAVHQVEWAIQPQPFEMPRNPSAMIPPQNCFPQQQNSKLLSLLQDEEHLSYYQCLVRKQIEVFEAEPDDVASHARGRNKPIIFGQVGLRCVHCKYSPRPSRGRGSVFFPSKLLGIYQAAQNMAVGHLCISCDNIPDDTKEQLLTFRQQKSSANVGKQYWAMAAKAIGLKETEHGLTFNSETG